MLFNRAIKRRSHLLVTLFTTLDRREQMNLERAELVSDAEYDKVVNVVESVK